MIEKRAVQPEVGMHVVSDIRDSSGRLLIQANTELTAKHIRALKMWGVSHVYIEYDNGLAEADEGISQLTPEQEAVVRKQVVARFSLVSLDHPVMERLFTYSLDKLARQFARKESKHAL